MCEQCEKSDRYYKQHVEWLEMLIAREEGSGSGKYNRPIDALRNVLFMYMRFNPNNPVWQRQPGKEDGVMDVIAEQLYHEQILEIERLKRQVFYLKWLCDNRDRTIQKLEAQEKDTTS